MFKKFIRKIRVKSLVVMAFAFVIFSAFCAKAEAIPVHNILTTSSDTTIPINLVSPTYYTDLVNNYKIIYDNTNTLNTYAVQGSNVSDGIINYGTIEDYISYATGTLTANVDNEAVNILTSHVSSNITNSGNITSNINNTGNIGSDSTPVSSIVNYAIAENIMEDGFSTNINNINGLI